MSSFISRIEKQIEESLVHTGSGENLRKCFIAYGNHATHLSKLDMKECLLHKFVYYSDNCYLKGLGCPVVYGHTRYMGANRRIFEDDY